MTQPKNPITRFEVKGLHGDRNVSIDFQDPVKILVDENGSGKTTILNIFASLLQGKIERIAKYQFNEVNFILGKKKTISFLYDDFVMFNSGGSLLFKRLKYSIPEEIFLDLIRLSRSSPTVIRRSKSIEIASEISGISPDNIYRVMREEMRNPERHLSLFSENQLDFFESDSLSKKINKFHELIPFKTLYFPTYRLVEENLESFSYINKKDKIDLADQLIQFGMQDVRNRWNKIIEEIRKSSVFWYSKISGGMLDELIDGIKKEKIDYKYIENTKESLNIVLNRFSDILTSEKKKNIIDLVNNGDISKKEFEPLAYFLSKFIQVYDEQKSIDNSIKNFIRVVNSYFEDKEIRYDESELIIQVFNKRTDKTMTLDKLSSGEKQIASLFTRLYLDLSEERPYIVVFDEPELSLSIEWQKKLLQDIYDSGKCALLLAATHSPFIFKNELAEFADVLDIEYLGENNDQSA